MSAKVATAEEAIAFLEGHRATSGESLALAIAAAKKHFGVPFRNEEEAFKYVKDYLNGPAGWENAVRRDGLHSAIADVRVQLNNLEKGTPMACSAACGAAILTAILMHHTK